MTTDDKDSKRIRERMHRRSFSIDVMRVDGKGKKADRWLCAVRGTGMTLDGPTAEGKTLKEALAKLADKIDEITRAEILS